MRLARTIRQHRDGILQAIWLGINRGRTETLNNQIRLITRRAYRYQTAEAALALAMLTCGPITVQAPHALALGEPPSSIPREPEMRGSGRSIISFG